MTTTILILVLALLAIALMMVEVLLVPGFGISGIGAVACMGAAVILIYNEFGMLAAFLAALAFFSFSILVLWRLSKSKLLDRFSLHKSIDSSNATTEQLSIEVGDEGVALTRLALIGNARICGKIVEVKSSGQFIEEGTALVVVAVNEALIVVEKKA